MKIFQKNLLGFLAVVVLMIVMGTSSIIGFRQIEEKNKEIDEHQDNIAFFIEKEVDHLRWLNNIANMFIYGVAPAPDDHTQCDLGRWYYQYQPEEHNRKSFLALEKPHIEVHSSGRRVIELFSSGNIEEARGVFQHQTQPAILQVQQYLAELQDAERQVANRTIREIEVLQRRTLFVSILLMVVATLGAIGIALVLNSQIATPIVVIGNVLKKLGDLDFSLDENCCSGKYLGRKDEVGVMVTSVKQMRENVARFVKETAEVADRTSRDIAEVSSAVQETASSVEEVASTTSEFASTIETTSSNSQRMADLAQNTIAKTNEGAEQIQRTVAMMRSIHKTVDGLSQEIEGLDSQSEQIRSIVDIITDIADQTNLLALNAAIEAARAGEHGRGFAVVAEEVRKLAEQSGKAAGEITSVIFAIRNIVQGTVSKSKESSSQVTEGASLVQDSGQMFTAIQQIVEQLTDGIKAIAAASQEMASAGEEIAASSEEQSATVEQIGASVENVAGIASDLKELVSAFKV